MAELRMTVSSWEAVSFQKQVECQESVDALHAELHPFRIGLKRQVVVTILFGRMMERPLRCIDAFAMAMESADECVD
jgi:hypothetical protein|eukprot:CAMPEP_0169093146 /NCGR_PEP_ID=MMETSP1015-20121227/17281_1 /TAXON_ID=342587 /ORGANISM="Karlodinium micrum, Strain CCMP2283" /LENGTH=76 /DNA_ID=CAMNT_0009153767 /DNA_START=426 /DNA_END=656 /DNA_ORIENTATION=+